MGTDGLPSSASISKAFMLVFVETRNKTGPRRSVGRPVIHLWVGVSALINETKPNRVASPWLGGWVAHPAGMLRAHRDGGSGARRGGGRVLLCFWSLTFPHYGSRTSSGIDGREVTMCVRGAPSTAKEPFLFRKDCKMSGPQHVLDKQPLGTP